MKKIAADRNYNFLKKAKPKDLAHLTLPSLESAKATYLQRNNNNLEAAFEDAVRQRLGALSEYMDCQNAYQELLDGFPRTTK